MSQANEYRNTLLERYRAGYEAFWQTPRTHGDRALTMEQMQAVIDTAQPTFQTILSDSAAHMADLQARYPAAFVKQEGESEPKVPARYTSSAYEYTLDPNGRLVLSSLKPDWQAQ